MSPKGHMSSMVMSSDTVCVLNESPLRNTFVVLQRDIKDVDFNELECRVMDYYYEHVLHMEDPHKMGPNILKGSDISGALDSVFAVGMSHHPFHFCTSGFVYH